MITKRPLADGTTEVTFHIVEYYDGGANTNRMVPRKIGFLTENELDFFELFCTVDKIGSKKALKAMGRPIKEMADAIQRQDVKWLTTMPGIGKQSAEQITPTHKNKVTKFAMASITHQLPDGTPVEVAVSGGVFPSSSTWTSTGWRSGWRRSRHTASQAWKVPRSPIQSPR